MSENGKVDLPEKIGYSETAINEDLKRVAYKDQSVCQFQVTKADTHTYTNKTKNKKGECTYGDLGFALTLKIINPDYGNRLMEGPAIRVWIGSPIMNPTMAEEVGKKFASSWSRQTFDQVVVRGIYGDREDLKMPRRVDGEWMWNGEAIDSDEVDECREKTVRAKYDLAVELLEGKAKDLEKETFFATLQAKTNDDAGSEYFGNMEYKPFGFCFELRDGVELTPAEELIEMVGGMEDVDDDSDSDEE